MAPHATSPESFSPLRILLFTVPFRPAIGGIETVSALLADEFLRQGHEVTVVTQSAATEPDEADYRIVRRPSARALERSVRWADVILHNNISLRLGWPQLLHRGTPWVIAHHTWTPRTGPGSIAGRVKHLAMRFATHIAVSSAIAGSLGVPSTLIPNPYADDVFCNHGDAGRVEDLVFLGRLVPDKGMSVLLAALAELRTGGERPTLTVIGSGPDEPRLRAEVRTLRLAEQVRFIGPRRGAELVAALNGHRVVVVPSVWEEPFGIVALEALACGAVPVVSRSGGLPGAVGQCGLVVPKADPSALADAIRRLLSDPGLRNRLLANAAAHLGRHTREGVARAYLEVLTRAYERAAPRLTRKRSESDGP